MIYGTDYDEYMRQQRAALDPFRKRFEPFTLSPESLPWVIAILGGLAMLIVVPKIAGKRRRKK